MFLQTVFSVGLGFSSSKSALFPLAIHAYTLLFPDGFTLDILRGFQGMGAAAAIPASVRRVASPIPDKCHPYLTSSSWVSWPNRSLPRVRDPSRSQRLPPVLLSVELWGA